MTKHPSLNIGEYTLRAGHIVRVAPSSAILEHPSMQHEPLYALPEQILDSLRDAQDRSLLDVKALRIERQLASRCLQSGIVGYYRKGGIRYDLLDLPEQQVERYWSMIQDYNRLKGRKPAGPHVKAQLRRRLSGPVQVQRGYAGWLVTNREYRAELAALTNRWSGVITRNGWPEVGLAWMPLTSKRSTPRSQHVQFLEKFAEFCIRWRLQGLASPDLPVPLGVHTPIVDPSLLVRHMQEGGFGMFLPDIFPIPGRDDLREVGQAVQDLRIPDHLSEWTEIVRRGKKHSAGVDKFGHMLVIQHFWNVLQSRRPEIFHRNLKHIENAIGEYLSVSRDYVGRLRKHIHDRLHK